MNYSCIKKDEEIVVGAQNLVYRNKGMSLSTYPAK